MTRLKVLTGTKRDATGRVRLPTEVLDLEHYQAYLAGKLLNLPTHHCRSTISRRLGANAPPGGSRVARLADAA